MTTALTLFLLLMTTTGCVLPAKLLQELITVPRPQATRFPKTILRGIVPDQKVDWVGNHTVVFTGHPVGTRTKSWLYSWDLKTAPKALLEGASNFCVDGETISLSIRNTAKNGVRKYRIQLPDKKVKFLGDFGYAKDFTYVSKYNCTVHPVPAPLLMHNWEELRPGEGYLDLGSDTAKGDHTVTRLDANLQVRHDTGIRIKLPILSEITDWNPESGYLLRDINLSPEELRYWQKSKRLTVWHLDANHRGHALIVPAGPWVNTGGGDITFLKARNGLVIISRDFAAGGAAGNAGTYLVQADGQYERLETGFISQPALSANGCLLAYSFEKYNDLRSEPHEGGRILVVANLCVQKPSF